MKEIPLTRGFVALVDDADYERVNAFKWCVAMCGPRRDLPYASRSIPGRTILMHREIIGLPPDRKLDHINGNGLDNQRANLRECTQGQNLRNTAKRHSVAGRPCSSKFKGVHRAAGRWLAQIQHERKVYRLGSFDTELEAAIAYDTAARQMFGEFARPNFPTEHTPPPLQTEDGGSWTIQLAGSSPPSFGGFA